MAIITGKLRDVWMNGTEPVLVISHPKHDGKIIREHLNIRQRDILKNASLPQLRIGSSLIIRGEVDQYNHQGNSKTCINKITSIKSI